MIGPLYTGDPAGPAATLGRTTSAVTAIAGASVVGAGLAAGAVFAAAGGIGFLPVL